MIKKNIIKLINLLTDIDNDSQCSYNESKNFDNKVNALIKYIENIKKRSERNEIINKKKINVK